MATAFPLFTAYDEATVLGKQKRQPRCPLGYKFNAKLKNCWPKGVPVPPPAPPLPQSSYPGYNYPGSYGVQPAQPQYTYPVSYGTPQPTQPAQYTPCPQGTTYYMGQCWPVLSTPNPYLQPANNPYYYPPPPGPALVNQPTFLPPSIYGGRPLIEDFSQYAPENFDTYVTPQQEIPSELMYDGENFQAEGLFGLNAGGEPAANDPFTVARQAREFALETFQQVKALKENGAVVKPVEPVIAPSNSNAQSFLIVGGVAVALAIVAYKIIKKRR